MFYSYKPGVGASKLARALRARVEYPGLKTAVRRRQFKPSINWGYGGIVGSMGNGGPILNQDISTAQSKVLAFTQLDLVQLPTPRWSNDYDTLRERIGGEKLILARRDKLSAGRGIVLVSHSAGHSSGDIPAADFFVEKLSYGREYRVHVFKGKAIHSQVKVKGAEAQDGAIARNYENGWLYTAKDIERWAMPAQLAAAEQLAIACMTQLQLDFGAVDLLENRKGKLYFLEVNSAPALRSNATFEAYLRTIKELWGIEKQ